MKILINVPQLNLTGGVSSLFNVLKIESNHENISLFIIKNRLPFILRMPLKYIEFVYKIFSVDIVHINPSLNRKSFLRDSVFAWLSLFFSKKLIVYWHGWEETYEKKIIENLFLNWVLKATFLKAQTTIVLGEVFEMKLRKMGYNNKIVIETNSAENKYITNQQPKNIKKTDCINILFLSRLEKAKGVYIAIETLRILNKNRQKYRLIIAGNGGEVVNVKSFIKDDEFIELAGYVGETTKHNLLNNSHIMFLPSYSEGLPLTLLEGMIYGLPIISRPIGGIPDIVINGENGFLIESLEPKVYSDKIEFLVNSDELYKQISINNIEKSSLFSPENVRERICNLYSQVNNEK
ncbi:glycosyltransferase family 4 protein [Lutibacter sp.]|uniref:glycosyltransferase family 4 protein n=1 Tax=Lutibacter sp. TaxID=1925666 RepID=UPI001A1EF506|nr:glycosyltransferase family 4 protein [Lutibacter sp.]MBI9041325.1 glycosyltransferase family 4 protein [Lutibacter sp.]